MTILPYLLSGLLLLTVGLAGILALRLATRSRLQKLAIERLTEDLLRSRQEAEQQKNKLAQRSDLDTVKDEFISTVSHELRTPLTSIRGALGLLSAGLLGNVDAKAHNLLRIASTNT
jgi:signal transduction histidine kinase